MSSSEVYETLDAAIAAAFLPRPSEGRGIEGEGSVTFRALEEWSPPLEGAREFP